MKWTWAEEYSPQAALGQPSASPRVSNISRPQCRIWRSAEAQRPNGDGPRPWAYLRCSVPRRTFPIRSSEIEFDPEDNAWVSPIYSQTCWRHAMDWSTAQKIFTM